MTPPPPLRHAVTPEEFLVLRRSFMRAHQRRVAVVAVLFAVGGLTLAAGVLAIVAWWRS